MTEPEQPKTEPAIEIKTSAVPPSDDPIIVEYADSLKESLGDLYDEELDKMPIKERIATMKLVKKSMDKVLKDRKSEGKAPIDPKPETKHKVKTVLERYEAGEDPIDFMQKSRTSVFSSARKNLGRL